MITTQHEGTFKERLWLRKDIDITSTHTRQLFALLNHLSPVRIWFGIEYCGAHEGLFPVPDSAVRPGLVLIMGSAISEVFIAVIQLLEQHSGLFVSALCDPSTGIAC